MKKCAILYTDKNTGEQWWARSRNFNGETYELTRKISELPILHQAIIFYGKNARQKAQKQIENDAKHNRVFAALKIPTIVEYEQEPNSYFELWYALEKEFGDKMSSEIKRRFPLENKINYKVRKCHNRPIIYDLPLEELKRYYQWRKENYRGKIKEI